MPILDTLKKPLEKMILNSPFHGLLSDDLALISFTDHHTGKRLAFPVEYLKENRFIRVLCPGKERCWKKFTYGAPVGILIRGKSYQGWAEIIDDAEEVKKEWKCIFKNKPDLATGLGIKVTNGVVEHFDSLPQNLIDVFILRIEISGIR